MGPLKTLGLAKWLPNFTGLAVSIFLAVMCLQSRFLTEALLESRYFARRLMVLTSRFFRLFLYVKSCVWSKHISDGAKGDMQLDKNS